MKHIKYILFYFTSSLTLAQTALHNAGKLGLHNNVQIGFHTDWINNANFEGNVGLIGFYGDNTLTLSGTVVPVVFDAELFVPNQLVLENALNVTNNFNFISGDVRSNLNNETVYLNFEPNAFFNGENDMAKVTGFAATTDASFFTFPVGDEEQLRPLILDSEGSNQRAICAYLFENPESPLSLNLRYSLDNKVNNIGEISDREFWILEADRPSKVTISWNLRSELDILANNLEDIILVGWSKSNQQWVVIGNSNLTGTLDSGFLISDTFVPSDFEVITFGTTPLPTDTFAVNNPSLGNYYLTPNNDGTNDALVFDELEDAGNNQVWIFNKFGQKVFEMMNYTNQFNGVSNINNLVIGRELGLPEGVYYYIIELPEAGLSYQGFLYLDRK
ncbi:Hypothetical protein I595_3586 [Croceitalea dokdonensis DOKDO 023]|uniref:Gliding motility-associated C-terminal domain-containing protein n=1 Tax=Croceitalea dokdonensis DOKDO 023 TaxID=1300341 RepID=A0A0P7A1N6_9FLAO|nr:gliding motility-associated C-terminal domain-containing protein [Croceitalea dokdonensis]KPM30290.1 Hypothetical protein I595_3586 [Croceitalea dokdonensis DOKDO 023]